MHSISRRTFLAASGVGAVVLFGCSGSPGVNRDASSASGSGAAAVPTLVVGTLATEDLLPLWVAQSQDMLAEQGVPTDIVTFQSATELIAGVASGEVDLAMTDIMVAASMYASGIDIQMEWVTLGTSANQGRFGIMVGPDSPVTSLAELAGVPIGVGSNTILEYVMDCLMESAGVPVDQVVVEEIQKLPVRYQSMAAGEVTAAALPATLLALGEANGCKLLADDTTGDNISQSVMVARAEVLADEVRSQQVDKLVMVWNEAAMMVNDDPESFRAILVQNANLPEEIAHDYPICEYPMATLPTSKMVDPVLDWMEQKGYLSQPLAYDEVTGEFEYA